MTVIHEIFFDMIYTSWLSRFQAELFLKVFRSPVCTEMAMRDGGNSEIKESTV